LRRELCQDRSTSPESVGFASARRLSIKVEENEPTLQSDPPCPERESRLKEYHDAVRAYRETVNYLDADLPREEFERSHRRAEEARIVFDRKREELRGHINAHGCEEQRMSVKDGLAF